MTLIILILLSLTYYTAWNITVIKNQGGENKTIFWVIMVSISITFNYLIFLPLICLIKTKLILTYGPFHPRKFFCSIKYFLFLLLITEVDRAVFKELKEAIKNNNAEGSEKILTSFFGLDNETEIVDQNDKKSNKDENECKEGNNNKKDLKENKENILKNKNNRMNEDDIFSKNDNYEEINIRDKNIFNINKEINKIEIEDYQKKENLEKEEKDKKNKSIPKV